MCIISPFVSSVLAVFHCTASEHGSYKKGHGLNSQPNDRKGESNMRTLDWWPNTQPRLLTELSRQAGYIVNKYMYLKELIVACRDLPINCFLANFWSLAILKKLYTEMRVCRTKFLKVTFIFTFCCCSYWVHGYLRISRMCFCENM